MHDEFPIGAAALHPDWPEARFNISGLFSHHQDVVMFMLRILDKSCGCRPNVEAIHGAPSVMWNGGRISLLPFKPEELGARFNALYSQKVGVFLTFTNHLLDEAALRDPASSLLLDAAAQRPDLNGIIISSELLSRHIAQKYPALRQVASITKVAVENGRGNVEYYRELGKRYHRYVVHPDDCHDLALLDRLDRDKAEIIVNENCLRDCRIRARHYDLIARNHGMAEVNAALATGNAVGPGASAEARQASDELNKAMEACPSFPFTRQIGQRRRNCNFTRAEFKAVYDMGFRLFKLQGRRDNVHAFVYDLTHYLLEPDVAAPFTFKAMCAGIKIV